MENARFKGHDSTFATRLRGCMSETKTTQDKLAKVTGITRQAISQYCDGSVIPNIEKLYLFAKHFEVSSDYLIGNTDVKKPSATIQAISEYTGLSEKSINLLNTSTVKSHTKFERPTYSEGVSFLIENDETKDKNLETNDLLRIKANKIHVLSNILKFLFRETSEKDNRPIALTYFGDIIDTSANIRNIEFLHGGLYEELRADESQFEESIMASELVNNWRLNNIQEGLKNLKGIALHKKGTSSQ